MMLLLILFINTTPCLAARDQEMRNNTATLLFKSIFSDASETMQESTIKQTRWLKDASLDKWIDDNKNIIEGQKDWNDNLLIHYAIAYPAYKHLAHKLIDIFPKQINAKNILNITPLDLAISENDTKLIQKLIDQGAEITPLTLFNLIDNVAANPNQLNWLLKTIESKQSKEKKIAIINSYPIECTFIEMYRWEKWNEATGQWEIEDQEEKLTQQEKSLEKEQNGIEQLNRKLIKKQTDLISTHGQDQYNEKQQIYKNEKSAEEKQHNKLLEMWLSIQHILKEIHELNDLIKWYENIKKVYGTESLQQKLLDPTTWLPEEKISMEKAQRAQKKIEANALKTLEEKDEKQSKIYHKTKKELETKAKQLNEWQILFRDIDDLEKKKENLERKKRWLEYRKEEEKKLKEWQERRDKKIIKEEIVSTTVSKDDPSRRYHQVKLLLKEGPLLHVAIKRKSKAIIERLLKHGADPNLADDQNRTPLHIAAQIKTSEVYKKVFQKSSAVPIVKLLLKYGAILSAEPDKNGKTILDYAQATNDTELIAIIEQDQLKISFFKLHKVLAKLKVKIQQLSKQLIELKQKLA